jgi:hypothetical protein
VDRVLAEVLPEDKAHNVHLLQAGGKKVAMVGDGSAARGNTASRPPGGRSASVVQRLRALRAEQEKIRTPVAS